MKQKLVVLSGAGISAESGLKTFRDNNGLWENHSVYDVATPEGFARDPKLVLAFYNQRRRQLRDVSPNAAHEILAQLQSHFDVYIITQNIDDLHERAGSNQVLHLHGELLKSQSSINPSLVYQQSGDINLGDTAEDGSQLRPNVVWFGEDVAAMPRAVEWVRKADHVIVIGTSMQVYPAASLVEYMPAHARLYVINPEKPDYRFHNQHQHIQKSAVEGMQILSISLLENL